MRFGTRPGPRTAWISSKMSATRPDAVPGSTSAIRAIDLLLSGRPLEGAVVGVLAGVIPAPGVISIVPAAADGGGHPSADHVPDIGDLRCSTMLNSVPQLHKIGEGDALPDARRAHASPSNV